MLSHFRLQTVTARSIKPKLHEGILLNLLDGAHGSTRVASLKATSELLSDTLQFAVQPIYIRV